MTQRDNVIAQLDIARTALAEARTIQETKKIVDIASAAEIYAKRQHLGDEAIRYATAIRVEALAQLGRMLKETPRATGTKGQIHGRDVSGGTIFAPPENTEPTLTQLGLDKKTSKLAQDIAELSEEQIEAVKDGIVSLAKAQRKRQTEKRFEARSNLVLPKGIFNVIYADPPWHYDNSGISGAAENHYLTMATEDICALKVPSADNSVLFLWVTNPLLPDGLRVSKIWGFEYKTNMVWVKDKAGQGFYVKGQHELLLISVKGSFRPDDGIYVRSVVTSDRGEHSSKPDIFYNIIETLYPQGKYLELFARNRRTKWESWGDSLEATT